MPAPRASRRVTVLAFAALYPFLLVGGAVLAWFFAGRPVMTGGLLIVGGGAGVLGAAAVVQLFKEPRRRVRRRWLACLYHGMALLGVLGVMTLIHLLFPRATVHIDNNYGEDVRLVLNSELWVQSPSRSTTRRWLRKGTYTLIVQSADGKRDLDRMEIRVDGAGHYVLNVLGAMRYYRGTAQYEVNARPGQEEPPEQVVMDRWFRANVDYLFEAPPEQINIQQRRGARNTRVERSYLERDPELPLREVP